MAKISLENKKKYNESIKGYRVHIEELEQSIKTFEKDILEKNEGFNNYRKFIIANQNLKIIDLFCEMSELSMSLIGIKNETYLNKARKKIYEVLIKVEEIISHHIDMPLTENEDALLSVDKIDPKRKIIFLDKIKQSIEKVITGFGENSKWKWSFVEMEGRYATITKNIINYKQCQASNDPREPFYSELKKLIERAKDELQFASKRYREKYELTTREPEDIKKSILLLRALRRIHIMFSNPEAATHTKRTIELYTKQMEDGIQQKEREAKKKRAKKK